MLGPSPLFVTRHADTRKGAVHRRTSTLADPRLFSRPGTSADSQRLTSSKDSPERIHDGIRQETNSTQHKTISLSQSIPINRSDHALSSMMEQMSMQIKALQTDLDALKSEAKHKDYVPRRLLLAVEAQLDAVLSEKEELQELRHSLLAEWRSAQSKAEKLQRHNTLLKRQTQQQDLNLLQDMTERLKTKDAHNQTLLSSNNALRGQVTELKAQLADVQQQEQALKSQLKAQDASLLTKLNEQEAKIKDLELQLSLHKANSGQTNSWIREWLEVTALTLAEMVKEATTKLTNELQEVGLLLDDKNHRLDAMQDKLRVKLESSVLYDPVSTCSASLETSSRYLGRHTPIPMTQSVAPKRVAFQH